MFDQSINRTNERTNKRRERKSISNSDIQQKNEEKIKSNRINQNQWMIDIMKWINIWIRSLSLRVINIDCKSFFLSLINIVLRITVDFNLLTFSKSKKTSRQAINWQKNVPGKFWEEILEKEERERILFRLYIKEYSYAKKNLACWLNCCCCCCCCYSRFLKIINNNNRIYTSKTKTQTTRIINDRSKIKTLKILNIQKFKSFFTFHFFFLECRNGK